jgi:hypothetical protein
VPESSRRKKPATTTPATTTPRVQGPNPRWYAPLMVGLMVVGLIWIVIFYITQQQYPVPGIGLWNLAIGFGIAMAGFLMTTRWR